MWQIIQPHGKFGRMTITKIVDRVKLNIGRIIEE